MNQLTVNSRAFYREFRNGAAFSDDLGVYSSYFKALNLERVKFETSITLKTFVLADPSNEIKFVQGTGEVFFEHQTPGFDWAIQGFKIGDTISIRIGAFACGETITNISTNILTTTDTTPVGAGIGLVDGTSYDDLKFYNSTIPTSLIFQFGITPNALPPPSLTTASPSFLSILDGQSQAYFADGIGASPETLTGSMTDSSEISESVTCEYITTTDDYIHVFEVKHIFRVPFFIAGWLTYLINQTFPFAFTTPNSLRYICQYKFGTSSTDPNEHRVFTDTILNGSVGFVGQNFTSGTGIYNNLSVDYEDASANVLDQIEATLVNTVTLQIKKTVGTFSAGQKAILYVAKLPTETEYSSNSDTWDENFIFDQVTAVDGGALIDGDFIKDLMVDVNADNTLLDIIFDIDYSTAQKALITTGDRYGIFVSVGDVTLAADVADDKIVWCDVNTFTKNTDIDGLILSNEIECYTAEKDPSSGTGDTSDFKLWNGRLEEFRCTFNLKKYAGANLIEQIVNLTTVTKIEAQLVTWDNVANVEGVLETFNFPLVSVAAPYLVGGAFYQYFNVDGFGNFNINPTAIANNYKVKAKPPGAFADQGFIVIFPMIIPDRTDLPNPSIPVTFFDDTKPNNNLNYKTSNYSGVGNFGIYVKLNVTVRYLGVVDTVYELYTEKSIVRDYDVDPPTDNWMCTHEILDEDNVVIPYFNYSAINRIKSTFSMSGAGALTLGNLVAEHVVTPKDNSEPGFRLHSSKDWGYDGNALEPIDGVDYVQITQDVPGNKIIVISQVKANSLDNTKLYKIAAHLYDNR